MVAAKNTDYINKLFKQKLLRIKWTTKNSLDTYLYLKFQQFATKLDRILIEIWLKLNKEC